MNRLFIGVCLVMLSILRLFQPGPENTLTKKDFRPDHGFAYHIADKATWPFKRMVIENGRPLLEAHNIAEVRNVGDGKYSWSPEQGLYFAPLGNEDPRNGGNKIYKVRTFIFVRLRYIATVVLLLALCFMARWWSPWLLRVVNRVLPPFRGGNAPASIDGYEDQGLSWDEFNLLTRIWVWWIGVDRRYKIALLVTFPITLMTFSIFTFHYMLIDHYPALPALPPNDQMHAGRWVPRYLNALTAYANIPVVQQVLAMIFQLGTGVIALRLWGLRSLTVFSAAIVLLIVAVHPNNLTTYYYTNWSPLYTVSGFLTAFGMLVAAQVINGRWSLRIIHIIVGGILVCLGVATYQSSMSVATTLAVGYAIMRLVEHDGNIKELLWRQFQPVWSMVIAGILGGILYIFSLKSLGIKGAYATAGGDMLTFAEVPRRFIDVTRQSFYALWVTQPEFNRSLKVILLVVLLMAVCFLMAAIARRYSGQKIPILMNWTMLFFLLIGLIMSTKTMFYLVSMKSLFIYRYNLAMPFFTAFCFYSAFATVSRRKFGLWRSATVIIACCVVFIFSRSDLLRQGILLAGHRHDLAMANRILERVESLPGLDLTKKYYLVRTGPYSSERRRMLNTLRPYDTAGGSHMDGAEIGSFGWAAEVPLQVLGSRVQFKGILDNQHKNRTRAGELVKKRNAKRWPDPSSIFIDGDMIVVHM